MNRDEYLNRGLDKALAEEALCSVEARAAKVLAKALGAAKPSEFLLKVVVEDWKLPLSLYASPYWYVSAGFTRAHARQPLWKDYLAYASSVQGPAGVICRGRDVKGRLYVLHNLWKVRGLPGRPQIRIPAYNDGEGSVLEELNDFGAILRAMGFGP